jgi:hypothetical protein
VEEKFKNQNLAVPQTLMIKNIENVQGDERDIIIFSIGYAKDKTGTLSIHFGSLNMAGGENRLNVAITRAREKIIVVSSILPEDLKTELARNDGPRLLKEFLDFVRSVAAKKSKGKPQQSPSNSDTYLKYKLDLSEEEVLYDFFPHADIVVHKEETYGSIIITDDNFYQQSLSAKHHHALLPRLLESKNWTHTAIYSRNFWLNPEKVNYEVEKVGR